jgi:hypothetical protein
MSEWESAAIRQADYLKIALSQNGPNVTGRTLWTRFLPIRTGGLH